MSEVLLLKQIQKTFKILDATIEQWETTLGECMEYISSISNLSEQYTNCQQVNVETLPVGELLPDVKERLSYKISSEIDSKLGFVQGKLTAVKITQDKFSKQQQQCMKLHARHFPELGVSKLTEWNATRPSIAAMLEMLTDAEHLMFELQQRSAVWCRNNIVSLLSINKFRTMYFHLILTLPVFLSVLLLSCLMTANEFAPHKFPEAEAFFEGWYMRLSDAENGRSYGFLFGLVQPRTSPSPDPLLAASILYSENCHTCKLVSYNAFFNRSQLKLTDHGHPIDHDPDMTSPAVFQYYIEDHINFTVDGSRTYFELHIGGASIEGSVLSRVPWGPGGEGPEGILAHLPLPLHWFVYSLRSEVENYTYTGPGNTSISGSGIMHMEKNWGKSFPPAWIWADGLNPVSNVTLSLSGGIVRFEFMDITAYLIGYRVPSKDLVLNFKPIDSIIHAEHDGCQGSVHIVATSFVHSINIEIISDMAAFSDCLYGPEETGFRKACVESYNARAIVDVYRFGRHIDRQYINNFALEFGGTYQLKLHWVAGLCEDKVWDSDRRDSDSGDNDTLPHSWQTVDTSTLSTLRDTLCHVSFFLQEKI